MFDIINFSNKYTVRRLTESDAYLIFDIYKNNKIYLKYAQFELTIDEILNDLKLTPAGVDLSHKYYVGMFDKSDLVCVLDLIDGYPSEEYAFIGLFIINTKYQNKEIGSQILKEIEDYLKKQGIKKVRLGINDGNPQSTYFWRKNQYKIIYEVNQGLNKILVSEKIL